MSLTFLLLVPIQLMVALGMALSLKGLFTFEAIFAITLVANSLTSRSFKLANRTLSLAVVVALGASALFAWGRAPESGENFIFRSVLFGVGIGAALLQAFFEVRD